MEAEEARPRDVHTAISTVSVPIRSLVKFMTRLFDSALNEELEKLGKLKDESKIRKALDFEYEQKCITVILENINEARIQFQVRNLVGFLWHRLSVLRRSFPLVLEPSKLCIMSRRALR